MWILLILSTLAALWWGLLWLWPSQRALLRFVYCARHKPDELNGSFPRDDVRHAARPDPEPWPQVTVIVPGRNEGHVLERTLGSLCAMDYPQLKVIFIDDQSTDDTAAICAGLVTKYPHLSVLHNTQPPRDGWIGKTWAVHQAEAHMQQGESDPDGYLLFTDSDLVFHPQCLKQMVRLALHRDADITSLLPRIRCHTPGELLGLFPAMTIINARLSLYACNDPRTRHALVAGGFLLVRREAYQALGGHAAVRGQVVEDVALGTRAKALGQRIFTAITHDLYTARMYEGWLDTYRGLKKNAYAGANYSPAFAAVIALFLLLIGALPPLYLAIGLYYWITWPTLLTFFAAVAAIIAFFGEIAVGRQTARYIGMWQIAAWSLPPGFLFYLAVFLGSVIDHYRGGNTWSGRRITQARPLAESAKI